MREREARTRHSAVNFGRKENLEKAGSFFGGFRDYLQKVPRFFEGREREELEGKCDVIGLRVVVGRCSTCKL